MVASFWKKALPYLLPLVAALGVLLGLVKMLLGAGRKMERADTTTTIIEDVKKRHEVDAHVERVPSARDELRKDWSRDG